MLIFGSVRAVNFLAEGVVSAAGNMSIVGTVLKIIDDRVLPEILHHITMQENDIPDSGIGVLEVDVRSVDLVEPAGRHQQRLFALHFHVHVWPKEVVIDAGLDWVGVVYCE